VLLGSEVHEVLEDFLSWGVAPDENSRAGRIAAAGLRFLPSTDGDLGIEVPIHTKGIDPPLVGYIDILDLSDPKQPVVIDHKTTSSWNWAKTSEQLRNDPQMIAYAQHALYECSAADTVEVSHIQYRTKGAPDARRVSAVLSREHVEQHWAELVELAAEMKKASLLESVEEAEPNYSSCGAFGGCPYADTCAAFKKNDKPFAGIGNLKSETQKRKTEMSRLAELKKRAAAKKAAPVLSPDAAPRETPLAVVEDLPAPLAPAEEAPQPAEQSLFTEAVPSKDRFSDEQYRQAAADIFSLMTEREAIHLSGLVAKAALGKTLELRRVRPYYVEKACLLSDGLLIYRDGNVLLSKKGSSEQAKAPAEEVVEEEEVALPVEEVAPEPKIKVKPFETAETLKAKKKLPKGKHVRAPEPAAQLVLYIDCLPLKGIEKMQTFEDVIEPFIQKVAENNKVASPLLMQYGEGKNHVAGLLRVQCPKGYVVVSSDNPYWASCKTVLIQSADVVIKGTR